LLVVFTIGVEDGPDVCDVDEEPAVVLVVLLVPPDFLEPDDPHAASTATITAAPAMVRVLITSSSIPTSGELTRRHHPYYGREAQGIGLGCPEGCPTGRKYPKALPRRPGWTEAVMPSANS
jgi:hypothetical protein